MVTDTLDILLLLALPASGKSELRRYIEYLDADTARRDLALGPTAQLDDYPYVHLMRRISQELRRLGEDPIFFTTEEASWQEPLDWITLIHLLNEDYAHTVSTGRGEQTAAGLLDRLDRARVLAGAPDAIGNLDPRVRAAIESSIATDVAGLDPITAAGCESTIIIEFSRGGPVDAGVPLPHPNGYTASIAALSEEVRQRASILYLWVEPEESRRRNRARAVPGGNGDASILHHGVPETVMTLSYGTDDMEWLESQTRSSGTIPVGSDDIPMQRIDNREDRTSFLRANPSEWPVEEVAELHRDLSIALRRLASR